MNTLTHACTHVTLQGARLAASFLLLSDVEDWDGGRERGTEYFLKSIYFGGGGQGARYNVLSEVLSEVTLYSKKIKIIIRGQGARYKVLSEVTLYSKYTRTLTFFLPEISARGCRLAARAAC
jgi:hypothetical protein